MPGADANVAEPLPDAPVIVFSARAGDEVRACGGLLSQVARRGERALAIIVNSAGATGENRADASMADVDLESASRAAAKMLSYPEPQFWREPLPGLDYREINIGRVLDVISAVGASVAFAPSLSEPTPDRLALGLVVRDAVRRSVHDCMVAFYGVDRPIPANRCNRVKDVFADKVRALALFVPSQSATRSMPAGAGLQRAPAAPEVAEGDADELFDIVGAQHVAEPASGLSRCEGWTQITTPSEDPLVSVVIRTTGRPELADALDSVAAQTYGSIEVVLVDVEGKGALDVRANCGRFPLRMVSRGQHLSRGAACNLGLDHAEGAFAVFLDDDDWFLPDHVHTLVAAVASSEGADAAYAGIECRRRGASGHWESLSSYNDPYDPIRLLVENYIPIHAVLFSRKLLGPHLRFDESLEFLEDWDFWLQLSGVTRLEHVDRVTAIYRISDAGGFGHRADHPALGRSHEALMAKWRTRWSHHQLATIAGHAATRFRMAISAAGLDLEHAAESDLRDRILDLEDAGAAQRKHIQVLERGVREWERAVEVKDSQLRTLEGSVAERDKQIEKTEALLTAERSEKRDALSLRTQLLVALDLLQSSASWQLARPAYAIEARWPAVLASVAAIPKLAWWTVTLRLRRRLALSRLGKKLLRTGLFDRHWYVENNPDVVVNGQNPVLHWLDAAWREGRAPNAFFDTDWYLTQNPDVASAGMNPLVHYLEHGAKEGRDPGPLFDTSWYLSQHPDLATTDTNPLAHYLTVGRFQGAPTRAPEGIPLAAPDAFVDLYAEMRANSNLRPGGDDYVLESDDSLCGRLLPVRMVAFYLPQFHPIPENDAWWGKGFTEWTNVAKAIPQFAGHYQPRLPDALGFYDLRIKEVQREQIRLAKKHGIFGFCYHYYWFAGHRLLERPLQQVLEDTSLDLPFCVCWANENWTRRWDGQDQEVLISQDHSIEDDVAFIADIEPVLRDHRYITVDGRPVLIVYRPQLLVNPAETAERWRAYVRDRGLPGLYLVNVHSFPEAVDPRSIGFDAAVEFPPHEYPHRDMTPEVSLLNEEFHGSVYDYRACVDDAEAKVSRRWPYVLFPGVMTGWDNTPRRPGHGGVYRYASPHEYARWLKAACQRASGLGEADKRLVFVNAWNEWAEGAYLEPDRRYGFAYLDATRTVLSALEGR